MQIILHLHTASEAMESETVVLFRMLPF